jgi:3-oxoacyl-[acyl-carrier protein] reductase
MCESRLLAGKTMLITGANNGIGAAVAHVAAREGANIAIHYLESARPVSEPNVQIGHVVLGREAAERVASEVRAAGVKAALVSANLLDQESPAFIFDNAERELGPIDILVNNAAHFENPDTILNITAGTLVRYFSVNVIAAVLLIRELAVRHRARGATFGRVLNISTDWARAFETQIGYGGSKSAMEAFTRSVARELGPFGITVNAVAPGPVQTGYITAELEQQLLPSIPLRRIGTPEDIAEALVFLASERSSWITGQVIQVAGGHAL